MRVKKNPMILLGVLLISALILLGCGSNESATDSSKIEASENTTSGDSETELKSFSKEVLAKYNGKDGNPAYIAVDGTVYDVTDVPQWKDGMHADKYEAGKDVTNELNTQAPHSASKMDGVPIVGVYAG
jgi:predicted heme/steroid binding protein